MPEAARVGDCHGCLATSPLPHVGGPILKPCSSDVSTNGRQQARTGDKCLCLLANAQDFIVTGSATVTVNGQFAVREGDRAMHARGPVLSGSSNVLIGGPTAGATLGNKDAGEAACKAAASGRASGKTKQTYNNCGVESARQLINKNGNPITEKELFDESLKNGDAETRSTLTDSGGTNPSDRQHILDSHGVPSHQVSQGMNNIVQSVAEKRGVITSHDAGILWNDPKYADSGHAIVITGVEYDEEGRPKNIIVNDTGTGECGKSIPADRFEKSLRPGRNVNVTDNPIWQ